MVRKDNIVEQYLAKLYQLRSTGGTTGETSLYSALEDLLNAVGGDLKPNVFCVGQMADQGAGHPDFGLYTATQCQKGEPKPGAIPERGVVEVKKVAEDAWFTANTRQVSRYWDRYRLVLVTNYRDFLLIGEDQAGGIAKLESFRLARNAAEFWSACASPRKAAAIIGNAFIEYLRRVLSHAATLREPRDVAFFLASYARDALGRVRDQGDLPALTTVRTALEQALGVQFQGEKGDSFFRSTLVQTLFYGIFSAWVLWAKQTPAPTGPFDWRTAVWHLRVPMIRTLFGQLAMPDKLQPLGLVEVLDWASAALSRVDRAEFFARFRDAHAVQYFYEPFLEAFDPDLKKELGVWYTPSEVVSYMVERVDRALRDDLGVADGLAAENVYVLDPCTGTGSFVVAVLRRIAATLEDRGLGALTGHSVKKAACERVFGFEIMPAPFVVAHLQVGVLLQNLGAPLAEDGGQRAGVYLTNALTGWEPGRDKPKLPFPELQEERDRADAVKRDKPILVILGNPPYNGFAGMAVAEERTLTEAYRTAKAVRQPEGQGLNDLYVRFFRMAERRIAEKTGQGVVCFVSNYSWLDGLSFTGMRERYLEQFDAIRIDCLNGDKYKTGKVAPDGSPDPSIFSTEHNREGIQVGTAIATLLRKADHAPAAHVEFRHLWGRDKPQQLADTATAADIYTPHAPQPELGLPFLPAAASAGYFRWPSLPDLLPTFFAGVQTKRDAMLVDIDRDALVRRLQAYYNKAINDEDMRRMCSSVMERTSRFDPIETRRVLLNAGLKPENIVRHSYRPFDTRWIYYEIHTRLLGEKSPAYWRQYNPGTPTIVAQQKPRREWAPPQFIRQIGGLDLMDRGASFFPLSLREPTHPDECLPNIKASLTRYLDANEAEPADVFFHALAALHAPLYRQENAGALRMDWPRVPLPEIGETLQASAGLGRQLADLLDPETPVHGVTAGTPRPELRPVCVVSRVGGGGLADDDMGLTAGWGHLQRGEIVMPGQGKVVQRDYRPEEIQAFAAGAGPLGLTAGQVVALLGDKTCDVYLNQDAYWANIPAKVWGYSLGGYQVIKKWLSYRERDVLGRRLRSEEVQEVAMIARRIAAILLLSPALDANFAAVRALRHDATGSAVPVLV